MKKYQHYIDAPMSDEILTPKYHAWSMESILHPYFVRAYCTCFFFIGLREYDRTAEGVRFFHCTIAKGKMNSCNNL